jgi:hypothetical protein
VSERGEVAGRHCARGRHVLGLALVVIAAAAVAACGGSPSPDIGPYVGLWQRVEGGEPDPGVTLTVVRQGDQGAVTFASLSSGQDQTVVATVEDGHLTCSLPTVDDSQVPSDAVSPPPVESHLQLSVDENGQLVVDLVLVDGTLEPIWIYDRAPASAAAEP